MRRQIAALISLAVCLTLNSPVLATDRLVPSQYPTIQAGIDAAVNGDVVIIDPNTYTGPGNRDIDFLGKAITVRSIDPDDQSVVAATVIDCQGSEGSPHRGFYFHSGEGSSSVVAGFTIMNGYATQGSGIRCNNGSSPTITHCNMRNNVADSGGAIYCMGNCGPLIHKCVIMGNSATHGSGLFFQDNCNATVTNCIISNNVSSRGGAILCKQHSSPLIHNCVITGNSLQPFGALYFWDHCSATVSNCTIWDNSGSGIYSDYYCNLTVKNCILHRLISGKYYYSNVTVSYSNIPGGYVGMGNIKADPCFVDAAVGDYHLLSESPCINAGDPCYSQTNGETDIDGDPRVINDTIDIGADEFVKEAPFISIVPIELNFFSYISGHNPEPQVLSIFNKGIGTLNWQINKECDWLSVEPSSGSSTVEVDYVTFSVDISGLAADAYTCNLTISDANAGNSPRVVTVNLNIYPVEDALYVPSEYSTIQAGIDAANDLDVIIVAPGTYTGTGNRDLDFRGKAIKVQSMAPENPSMVAATVIDCQGDNWNHHRGFYFHSGEEANSVLSGFTIKRGRVTGRPAKGGAIYCSGASPTIKNCVITSNSALGSGGNPHGGSAQGGGVYCESNSYATLIDCTVSSNRAIGGEGDDQWCSPMSGCSGGLGSGGSGYGGGIYSSGDSGLTIVDCIISDNSASGGSGGLYYEDLDPMVGEGGGWAWGGGVYCGSAAAVIKNCSIVSNTIRGGDGGQVENPYGFDGERGMVFGGGVCGEITISDSIISSNYILPGTGEVMVPKSGGGGICCTASSSIVNCLISDNSATSAFFSTGIHLIFDDNHSIIKGCTISNNMADYYPPPYAVDDADNLYTVSATITDSIIWGHGGRDVSGVCSVTYSCTEQNVSGTGNIHDDPLFVTGPQGYYYLSQIAAGQAVDSACVDAGSDTAAYLGMDIFTTRTDEVGDKGCVDMGYHYPAITMDGNPDIDGDRDVDFFDYAWFTMGLFYGPSKQIPRGSVVVDADLSDWPGSVEWIDLDKVYYGSPNDVSEARFALQWDDETNKVYAAVVLNDTNHVFLDEYVNWKASDRLEVYSQGDAEGGSGWLGTYDVAQQYYVAPDTSDGNWATWAESETLGADVGLEYAVGVEGEQIIYEVGVRMFDNYGGFSGEETVVTNLDAGDVIGFDLVACTRRDTVNFGMLSENLMARKSNHADKFARYMLVDEIFSVDLDGTGANNYADLGILFENWLWGK